MDITRIFQTSSNDISDFFTQPGAGYYIPLYQREYAWDKDNIDQLMDNIYSGVSELITNQDTIHFLGTIILCTENDKSNIQPQDPRAIPTRVDNIIDGQQRISTIALLACCLYQRMYEIKEKLPNKMKNPSLELDGLKEAVNTYLKSLQEIFSFDLQRGTPERKPIIIRCIKDKWICEGEEENSYKSDISLYLARFIKFIDNIEKNNNNDRKFPEPPKNSLTAKNTKAIQSWLNKVEKAYENNENYPSAWEIITKIDQSELWSYERKELYQVIKDFQNLETKSLNANEKLICSLVQLFAFCHYLLKRCSFTVIRPQSEVRAFDMFQSLNATGTPLTAIETFKPLIINIAETNKQNFADSKFNIYFSQIEDLMKKLKSASSKNKRTNDYLNLFALTYEGKSLRKQFSSQRQWLINKLENQFSLEDKELFIYKMGQIAMYCQSIVYSDDLKNSLPDLKSLEQSERDMASFCLLYLKEANHNMADAILSRFYSNALSFPLKIEHKKDSFNINSAQEFVVACQVVTAFFTLWRSSLENKELDNVYRTLIQKNMCWEKDNTLMSTTELKRYFHDILRDKGICTKDNWKYKAKDYLKYNKAPQKVCKFILFITSYDTIPDTEKPGLMKKGTFGSSTSYLNPDKWTCDDLRTVEHIAPRDRKENSKWDENLYENDDYEQIGNLTLLPTSINCSASNKEWLEKWFYYQHLGETDPDKLKNFKRQAKDKGIELNDSTIQLLQEAKHAHHIKPIIAVGDTGNWDLTLVQERTDRICDILWDRMSEWLSLDQED